MIDQEPSLGYENKTLFFSGDITFESVSNLYEKLEAFNKQHVNTLDCSDIGIVDSSAVSFFIEVIKRFRKKKGVPALFGINKPLNSLLDLYGLNDILQVN